MFSKIFFIYLALILIGIWACNDLLSPPEKDALTLEQVLNLFMKAQEDFLKDIPQVRPAKSTPENNNNLVGIQQLSLKNQILVKYWEAYYANDEKILLTFLQQHGLHKKHQHIIEKYHLNELDKLLDELLGEKSLICHASDFDNYQDGYIVSWRGDKINDLFLYPWHHSAIIDHSGAPNPNECMLSAHPDSNIVYYESRAKWLRPKLRSVLASRVRNASRKQGQDAVSYIRGFIGRPYSLLSTKSSDNEWYCTKLIWRAWKSQGYDVDQNGGDYITPNDIVTDSDVETVRSCSL